MILKSFNAVVKLNRAGDDKGYGFNKIKVKLHKKTKNNKSKK